MRAFILLATAALLALPAAAQSGEEVPPPDRISTMVVYGNDPCPRGQADEIVVCAREPEGERYRVPKRFRDRKPRAAEESWSNTVRQLEWVSRVGTPNSCSPVGSGGATGCYRQLLEQARAEREQARREAAGIP